MSDIKIADAFKNGKAFIPFITGGDPDLDTTKKLIIAMQEAGSDLIEIGIPFSDPIAEGPVIQEADERALSAGVTTDKLFDMLKELYEEGGIKVPMVFLTYANAIFAYGKEKFMKRCKESGMLGVIVPDIPYEEKEEFEDVADEYGISMISMIAPTSKERIKMIAGDAKGFLYVVSSMGVTGIREEFSFDIEDMISAVREVSDIPAAVGFGISNPEKAREMAAKSDGAIVGSAIVKIVGQYGKDCVPYVSKFVKELKDGVRKAN